MRSNPFLAKLASAPFARGALSLFGLLVGLALVAPAQASVLDGLFGFPTSSAPQAASRSAPPARHARLAAQGGRHAHKFMVAHARASSTHRRHATTLAKAPAQIVTPLDAPRAIAAILTDLTLRPGDAYVGDDGLRVYTGPTGARPSRSDFVPLSGRNGLGAKLRAKLNPYDDPAAKSRNEARAKAAQLALAPLPPPRPAGLSAIATQASRGAASLKAAPLVLHSDKPAIAPLAANERIITDIHGRSIRLVGGFVAFADRP